MKNKILFFLLIQLPLVANAYDAEIDGIFYNFYGHEALVTYQNYQNLSYNSNYSGTVIIPESVVYNDSTFTVTQIGDHAFSNCGGLKSVTIPNSVVSIGEYAFYFCSNLESIDIPSSVSSIDNFAFTSCSNLNTLSIPGNVKSIGTSAFNGCKNIASLELSEGIESIGSYAFENCKKLLSVTIPSTVKTIGSQTFANMDALVSISVAPGNTIYDSRNNCNAIIEKASNTLISGCQSTIIPESITSIGEYAFYFCSNLESIDIPSSVSSIGNFAFTSCSNLNTLSIPGCVKSIGTSAFNGCKNIASLELSEGIETIGSYAFENCDKLLSVNIPSTVKTIDSQTFANMDALVSISVAPGNTIYDSRNNCNAIIEKASNTLISGCQSTIIPESITSIGEYAFYFCSNLESIDIPSSVTSIGNFAFTSCSNLNTLSIPGNVKSIGTSAFNGCKNIASLELSEGIETIGSYAFENCKKLLSVTIPSTVVSIGSSAFRNCNQLIKVVSMIRNPFPIDDTVFSSIKSNAVLYVPVGTKEAYLTTDGWNFADILENNNDDNYGNDDEQIKTHLVLWAKNGSIVAFALCDNPKLTFTETDIQITGRNIDVTYALDNMALITYEAEDYVTPIKDIETEDVSFNLTGESLLFPALKANSKVSIYSLNGTLIFKKSVQADGEYSFPLSNLDIGVYIIKVNGITYKIVKR